MDTKDYREVELAKVSAPCSPYKPSIKITTPNGETNWFAIEPSELRAIAAILLA